MASRELASLVKELSTLIILARESFQPGERNEEWTKAALIVPLLEGLGWDRGTDVGYENSPDDIEGRLDLILKCKLPIGIESKALDVGSPRDHDHPHIKKGLKQSQERGASYFIWTNGDCWQFSSLALANAPVYEVIMSSAGGGAGQVDSIVNKLCIIEKGRFTANPEIFDEAIRTNWKMTALPDAWKVLLEKHKNDLLPLVRKGLPSELDIKNEEILEFLGTLKASDVGAEHPRSRTRQPETSRSFPDAWKQLLNSFEPDYDGARKRFCRDYYRKLGHYLISEKYEPWSKSTTWRRVGVPDEPNERKKLGLVIVLFREWRFIEETEGSMYKRVEESVPYLKTLLEEPASP